MKKDISPDNSGRDRQSTEAKRTAESILGPIPFLTGHGTHHGLNATEVLKGLPNVKVNEDRIIKELTGLRPYRPSGYCIKSQKLGSKQVIHNYGHGGAGITLSWGTAMSAIGMVGQPKGTSVAVIGSGIIGLTTAILLQRKGYRVTIYSKAQPLETTSNVAAAFWAPVSIYDDNHVDTGFKIQFKEASDISLRMFREMEGKKYGVSWIKTFIMTGGAEGTTNLDLSQQTIEEVRSLMISPPVYLNALMSDFQSGGGELIIQDFITLRDLNSLEESAIMNCTGLGSYDLFDDKELIPVKGQLIIMEPQPEIDYSYILDSRDTLLYMFPRADGIILGGTMEHGNWSTECNIDVRSRILKGHSQIACGMSQ